jgi:hypothetical protein
MITLALDARLGKTATLSQVTTMSGGPLTAETSDAAAFAATTSAYYLSGNHAVLRLDGATDALVE